MKIRVLINPFLDQVNQMWNEVKKFTILQLDFTKLHTGLALHVSLDRLLSACRLHANTITRGWAFFKIRQSFSITKGMSVRAWLPIPKIWCSHPWVQIQRYVVWTIISQNPIFCLNTLNTVTWNHIYHFQIHWSIHWEATSRLFST